MKSGEIYRGLLLSAEDTMNVSLSEVIRTAQNGKITKLPNVYLRGSGIRFIALPDLLKNAPCFQKVQTMKRKMEEAQAQREGECHMLMFRLFPEIFFVGLQRRYLMLLSAPNLFRCRRYNKEKTNRLSETRQRLKQGGMTFDEKVNWIVFRSWSIVTNPRAMSL